MTRHAGLTPQEFVEKWRRSKLKESAGSQSHFNDLCTMLGHPTPAKADPEGTTFTFEKGASKLTGGQGWADVWKKGFFAWEYKGKHKNLDAAFDQLQLYRDALLNPPLLIVSDMETIIIHTNFTNTIKRKIVLTFDDLLTKDGLGQLRSAFEHPEQLRSEQTTEGVTQQAATEFGKLAESLREAGHHPEKAAHFLIRILFCLFAEDIGLLPESLFTKLIDSTKDDPKKLHELLQQLFGHMAEGGFFGLDRIPHFNGGIFDSAEALTLNRDGLEILSHVAKLDWSSIEPSIFGTLFERGLDPGKRAQLGAHYTSRDDILLIVEPVLMRPLRRRWDEVKEQAEKLAKQWRKADTAGGAKTRLRRKLEKLLHGFADEIADTRVLDPACGSGNFLYVALRQLLNLEKDVIALSANLGLGMFFPTVSPEQLYGIEINEYAHELAQATIWIGYIQWLRENGFGQPSEPILKALDNIHQMDAILAFDDDGNPVEPDWPEADVVIGNPPFLGDKLMRRELGDFYVQALRSLYSHLIPGQSDLCCYWFEKARAMIEKGTLKRAGLLATQGIRGGANRRVLQRIKETGDIFWAISDRVWVLDGATVHVSMAGFGNGEDELHVLDGNTVSTINANLTSSVDIGRAKRLSQNRQLCFLGVMKAGPFDITEPVAFKWLLMPNPNGYPNSNVLRPRLNARDILRRTGGSWIIDFGCVTPMSEAAGYEHPFKHVMENVRPLRDKNRRKRLREKWWLHGEARPGLRKAIGSLSHVILTPEVSKHRVFVRIKTAYLPDHQTRVFCRSEEFFFGVLHSRLHQVWSLAQGTQLRERESGFRYTPTTCFETFPFPWTPGEEPLDDPFVKAITVGASELIEKRDRWLDPPEWTKAELLEFLGTVGGPWDAFIDSSTIQRRSNIQIGLVRYPRIVPRDAKSETELKKRTLTNLYNQRPTWLDLAHKKLDEAVLDAYGWPHDITDDEILEHLLALNLERVAAQERT